MSLTTQGKRWIGFIAVLLGSLSLAGCFHGKGHHRGGEMMFEYAAWKLDLSEEQQALLEDVRTEMKKIREQNHEQRQQGKAELIGLIEADTLDTSAAMNLFNKRQAIIATHAPQVLDKIAAFHATLTPEQKEIIIEKLNKMDKYHD